MRENRTHGSEGGEDGVLSYPYHGAKRCAAQAPAPDTSSPVQQCVICEREYEGPDMAHCPAYRGAICSLCCTLDARCGDLCKPHASLSAQWSAALRWLLTKKV